MGRASAGLSPEEPPLGLLAPIVSPGHISALPHYIQTVCSEVWRIAGRFKRESTYTSTVQRLDWLPLLVGRVILSGTSWPRALPVWPAHWPTWRKEWEGGEKGVMCSKCGSYSLGHYNGQLWKRIHCLLQAGGQGGRGHHTDTLGQIKKSKAKQNLGKNRKLASVKMSKNIQNKQCVTLVFMHKRLKMYFSGWAMAAWD